MCVRGRHPRIRTAVEFLFQTFVQPDGVAWMSSGVNVVHATRLVCFPAVFSAGQQTSLVAWMSSMPLDKMSMVCGDRAYCLRVLRI